MKVTTTWMQYCVSSTTPGAEDDDDDVVVVQFSSRPVLDDDANAMLFSWKLGNMDTSVCRALLFDLETNTFSSSFFNYVGDVTSTACDDDDVTSTSTSTSTT